MVGSTLIAAGGGVASAFASVAAMDLVAPLPLLLVGLGLGVGAGGLAAAAGTLAFAVLVAFGVGAGGVSGAPGDGDPLMGSVRAAGAFGGAHALPAWLMVWLALSRQTRDGVESWTPVGTVLAWLAAFGAVAASVVLMVGSDGNIEPAIGAYFAALFSAAAPTVPDADIELIVGMITPLFIGMMGGVWIVLFAVNAVVAQGLLTRGGRNRRPTPKWSALRLPDWLSWPLVVAAAVGLLFDGDLGYLGRNLVVMLATPYFLLGLAVVHGVVRAKQWSSLVLVAMYGALVPFLFYGAPVLAAIGIAEQWIGVRRRFGVADEGSE